MQNILYNISQVLGLTIIHSLGQALLIYFILRIALTLSGKISAAVKYWLAATSLLAITAWFIYTLIIEINIYNWLAVVPQKLSEMPLVQNLPSGIGQFKDQGVRYYYDIEGYLPYIAILYVAGLFFNTARLILARKKISAIRQNMSIDISLQYHVNKFTALLNINEKVKIGLSKLVDVPCMTGYFKPVILLPFTLATYLSTEEIEAILLHELAHIKRNDYLVNVLQQIISILLFFNPCVLLINRIINEERENCCDDLVVKATADPIIYAKALLKLEQTRQNDWKLALAATGKKYHLLNRIERIMKTKKTIPSLRPALLATLILAMGIGCMAMLNPEIAQGKISVKTITPIFKRMLAADTSHKTPVKKTVKLQAHVGKKVHHNASVHYTTIGDDKKMEALNAEIQEHADAISKYYSNEDFKKLQENINALSHQIQDFYNRPDLKQKQEELQQAGQDFSKNYSNNNGDQQKLSEEMGKTGQKISAYFISPEFKKLDREERLKYGIPLDKKYDDDNDLKDENYQNYKNDVESKLPPEVKVTIKQLEQMGKQMSARFETPEYKEKSHRMQELGDSLTEAYKNPEIKEKQDEINKLSLKISDYQNNAEIKKEQELLNEASQKMAAYVNSPQFKAHLNELKKMNFNYNFNFKDDSEKPEKPEKPEAPEQPEAPENN